MKSFAAMLIGPGIEPRVEEYDLRPLEAHEATVEMLYAPINPADLNIIEGKYGRMPAFPAVLGQEGVGRVVEVGADNDQIQVGDYVLSVTRGTWCRRRHVRMADLIKLPQGIDLQQAAMLTVNPPTAYRLLVDFVTLSTGEWIVQNASNSGVGSCVIQIARELGLHSLNVVRRSDVVGRLRELGADVVVKEEELMDRVETLCKAERPRLGLNAVGGASALNLANALANEGALVTYGAMGRQPLKIPNGLLIFRNLTFHGFWLTRWMEKTEMEAVKEMFNTLIGWCMSDKLKQPVDRVFSLKALPEALAAAAEDRRCGKVLLKLN